MSSAVVGEMRGFPWVTLTLGVRGEERNIRFIIDTGYDGELAVPSSFVSWLGTPKESQTVRFANGKEEQRGILERMVRWFDGERVVNVMYIDGENPLIGLELLEGCRLTIDVENGGEIIIEPL